MTKKVIDNSFEVLTIQAITILQAIDYLKCQDKLSQSTRTVYTLLRNIIPKFVEDRPRYEEQAKVKDWLIENTPL